MALNKIFYAMLCALIMHSSIWSAARAPRVNLSKNLLTNVQTAPAAIRSEIPQAMLQPEKLKQVQAESLASDLPIWSTQKLVSMNPELQRLASQPLVAPAATQHVTQPKRKPMWASAGGFKGTRPSLSRAMLQQKEVQLPTNALMLVEAKSKALIPIAQSGNNNNDKQKKFSDSVLYKIMISVIAAFILTDLKEYLYRGRHGFPFSELPFLWKWYLTSIGPKLRELEDEYDELGYATFVHGRPWRWNFVNDVWNIIHAIKYHQATISDRISLRFRTGTENIDTLKQYRESLVRLGGELSAGTALQSLRENAEITCMNKTVFSNFLNYPCCTAKYVLGEAGNHSDVDAQMYIQKLFEQEGLYSYYRKYKSELNALAEVHKKSNLLGELLLIAISKDDLDSMVYPATSFGRRRGSLAASQDLKRWSLNPLAKVTKPEYYCFAVTDIPGEYAPPEQHGKYFIQSFNPADPVRYHEYSIQRDKLFEKMRKNKPYLWGWW